MKKVFLVLSLALATFASCSKNDNNEEPTPQATEVYIDATSKTAWHYFSFSGNKLVGSGDENKPDNEQWFARKDWDIAINRYSIRTNSGLATTVNSQGGVYTFDIATLFNSVSAVPADAKFIVDKSITSSGMTGPVTIIRSEATVIKFKKSDDGSMIMPPVYEPAPVYIFRSADGKTNYKVQFTQYQNENKQTGHVKFIFAKIN